MEETVIKELLQQQIRAKFAQFHQIRSSRPQFVIVYQDLKGVESYWPFATQDLGLAGTGYVNLATGALTVVKPLEQVQVRAELMG